MFTLAFQSLKANPRIMAVPIIVDVLLILITMIVMMGVLGINDYSIKPESYDYINTTNLAGITTIPSVADLVEFNLVLGENINEGLLDQVLNPQELADISDVIPEILIGILLLTFITTVIWSFLEAGFLGAIKDGLDNKQIMTAKSYLENGKAFFVNLVKYRLLIFLLITLALIGLIIMISIISPEPLSFLLYSPHVLADVMVSTNLIEAVTVYLVILAVIVIIVSMFLLFVPYAIVDDNLSALKAIQRSYYIVKSNLAKVIGYFILVLLFMFLANLIVTSAAQLSIMLAVLLNAPFGCLMIYVYYCLYRESKKTTIGFSDIT